MITRRNTIVLAAITAVCVAVAGILGNHGHGLRQGVAGVAWFGFILGLLLLLVVGLARLARWAGPRGSATE